MAIIKIKGSTTASAVPSSLVSREIAINETDRKLFSRNESGTVIATDLDHDKKTNNPHGTTAAHVGAYTSGQTDAAIAASISGKLNASSNDYIKSGGGGGQDILGSHAIKLGWSTSGNAARIDVDAYDAGNVWTDHLGAGAPPSGWVKLPNGLYMQWGSQSVTFSGGLGTINFPQAFPNACASVVVCNADYAHTGAVDAYSWGTSTFQARYSGGSTCYVNWMAFGR